jgi:hypothetical protein
MSTHALDSRGAPGGAPPGQHSSADEQRAATRREVMVP